MATTSSNYPPNRCSCAGLIKRAVLLFFFCCGSLFLSFPSVAQAPTAQYKLEAVFLFNFAQFVEWPSSAFPSADAPFTIGVLGKDPFGTALDETVAGEAIKGRKIQVERYRDVKEIKNCQILFISASEEAHFERIFTALKSKPILTAGDGENFARKGGIVRFVTAQPKIRLRINVDALAEAKLTASSKLLRLAEVVHTDLK
jgi:hypothetical protein